MAELPKIVQHQLARQSQSGTGPDPFASGFHPDANLLSAFAEQSLTPAERERVLGHLADCAACRELVALAFPVPEVESDASGAPAPRPRWSALPVRSRALRWGILVASAGFVLVGAFRAGILRWPSDGTAPEITVAERAPSGAVASRPAPGQAPPAASNAIAPRAEAKQLALSTNKPAPASRQLFAEAGSRLKDKEAQSALKVTGGERAKADRADRGVATARPAPPTNEEDAFVRRTQKRAPAATPSPSAPPPAANSPYAQSSASASGAAIAGGLAPPQQQQEQQQQQVTAEAIQIQGSPAIAADKKANASEKSARDSSGSAQANARAQTGAAGATGAVGGALDARAYQLQRLMAKAKEELKAYWTISASGKLQRSRAPGGPWRDVSVDDSVTFKAVAADGANVWAGGSAGALYHSTDGGEHWTRVRVGPDQNGRKAGASGSIVTMKFFDAEHGIVVTDTGEKWTTFDGGAHWSAERLLPPHKNQ